MVDCQNIHNILADYINHKLNQQDRCKVVVHLASCKECREEMAFLIKLKNNQTKNLKEIPTIVKSSAFNLISEIQSQHRSLLYLDLLYDSLKLISQTVRFAKQIF